MIIILNNNYGKKPTYSKSKPIIVNYFYQFDVYISAIAIAMTNVLSH